MAFFNNAYLDTSKLNVTMAEAVTDSRARIMV